MNVKLLPIRLAAAGLALTGLWGVAPAQGTSPVAPRQTGAVPKAVIAVIDSSVFPDQVSEIKVALDRLRVQFDAKNKELQGLVDRMTALENQAKQGTATPQQQEQMAAQYAQLKKEAERKGQDLDDEKQRAFGDAMAPIRTKMNAALRQFAQARGITMVLEVNVARQTNQIFYVAETSDITRAFVEEYNRANPAR